MGILFLSRYKPINKFWSKADVIINEKWYLSWIVYIEKKFNIRFLNKEVFEIGSGVGGICSVLIKRNALVTGSDISRIMIKLAHKNISGLKYIYLNIQKKIKKYQKYDIIISFEVLEHLQFPQTALKNIKRLLKYKGIFVGSSPYSYEKNYSDPTHVNIKYIEEWRSLFLSNGFKKVTYVPLSFPPLLWRIHPKLNISILLHIPFHGFVSTTLIIARK